MPPIPSKYLDDCPDLLVPSKGDVDTLGKTLVINAGKYRVCKELYNGLREAWPTNEE